MKTGIVQKVLNLIGHIASNKMKRTIAIICLVALLAVVAVLGTYTAMNHETKSTQLGFKNIGELATQVAYCSEVSLTDSAVQLWGWNLPFTQSKYIYSYDVAIKAGLDFKQIEWTVDKPEKKVTVKLPEVKVLSCEIDPDSFKVYHEKESVFNRITLTDNNDALKMLRDNAINSAIENGLFENARANAELLIAAFLRSDYPEGQYTIEFVN